MAEQNTEQPEATAEVTPNPVSAQHRAQYVAGLQNEHDYLTRQPTVDKKRVAEVKAQLDVYSDSPADPQLETRG